MPRRRGHRPHRCPPRTINPGASSLSRPLSERVLALAGVIQALAQVRRIAETGQSDAAVVQTALESVFRIDADTPEAVYGRVANLAPGLRLLRDY
ncbi:MAG: DUF489 family protein, partial [Lysobacteraceae bacterium]